MASVLINEHGIPVGVFLGTPRDARHYAAAAGYTARDAATYSYLHGQDSGGDVVLFPEPPYECSEQPPTPHEVL